MKMLYIGIITCWSSTRRSCGIRPCGIY